MIYLATPYSHRFPWVRWWRWIQANRAVAYLMRNGVHAFSPIAHCYMSEFLGGLPGNFEFWEEYDRSMIARCDMFVVLMLPGWNTSRGVAAERAIAEGLDRSVIYIEPDCLDMLLSYTAT